MYYLYIFLLYLLVKAIRNSCDLIKRRGAATKWWLQIYANMWSKKKTNERTAMCKGRHKEMAHKANG